MLGVLEPDLVHKTETATRVRSRIELVLDTRQRMAFAKAEFRAMGGQPRCGIAQRSQGRAGASPRGGARKDVASFMKRLQQGWDAVREIERQWRFGGAHIDDVGHRREAFNVMLSMPRGTDPQIVLKAAREFAKIELADHRYVMVLHTHQANPHVHLSVKAESKHGERLNPRKDDLRRWRETFAERLREWGVDAEATRQAVRGAVRNYPDLWRKKAAEEGRERNARPERKMGKAATASRRSAGHAWAHIAAALQASLEPEDRRLAASIERFVTGREPTRPVSRGQTRSTPEPRRDIEHGR